VISNSRLASLVTPLLLLHLAACGIRGDAVFTQPSSLVELLPIDLDEKNPERRQFGRLTLLSAFELHSKDARFGGLSGLSISADGKLYAISDRGYWLSARMRLDSDGRLLDLFDWEIKRLLTPEKKPVSGLLTDAEALARAPDGSFIVAFEQVHRLWRYPPPPNTFDAPAAPVAIPREIAKAPNNGGIEAVTFLSDGRFLVITEEFENPDGSSKGWLIDNGRFTELSYIPTSGFRPSDCAALRNGDVIVLERRYAPFGIFAAVLKLVRRENIRSGARLIGEELLRLDRTLQIDNFEGVAVEEHPDGPIIYMVSDDNYHPLQRTLLLQFQLWRP